MWAERAANRAAAAQVQHGEQESDAHQLKSGSDRSMKQAQQGPYPGRCLAQTGGSDPAREGLCAGEG